MGGLFYKNFLILFILFVKSLIVELLYTIKSEYLKISIVKLLLSSNGFRSSKTPIIKSNREQALNKISKSEIELLKKVLTKLTNNCN